jgi:hypothetical protein
VLVLLFCLCVVPDCRSSSDVRKAATGGPVQAKLDTDGSLRGELTRPNYITVAIRVAIVCMYGIQCHVATIMVTLTQG